MNKPRLMSLIGLMVLALSLGACEFNNTVVSHTSSEEVSSETSASGNQEPNTSEDTTSENTNEPNTSEDTGGEPNTSEDNPNSETTSDETSPSEPGGDENSSSEDEPACTHEWFDNYDSNNHWIECSICGEKANMEPHDMHEAATNVDATCGDDGVYDTYCTGCSYTTHEVLSATGDHVYDTGVVTLEPTCTEDGQMTYTCEVCHKDSYTESISKTGHSFGDEYEHDQTSHWKVCLNGCGTETTHIDHTMEDGDVLLEETCTTDGYRYINCEVCNYQDYAVIAAHHTPGDTKVVNKEPTCTEEGEQSYECQVCHEYIDGEPIDALGHDEVQKYDETGHWVECQRCYEVVTEKTGHSYDADSFVTHVDPECEKEGNDQYKCVYCPFIYVDAIDPIGHDWEVKSNSAACTTDGTLISFCLNCGAEKVETSPMLGHLFADTYSSDDDYHYYECTRDGCDAKDGVEPHNYPEEGEEINAPTCSDYGTSEYICTACGHSKTEDDITPLGHEWVEDIVLVEPTCTTKGTMQYVCD